MSKRLKSDIDLRPGLFRQGAVVKSLVCDLYGHITGFHKRTDGDVYFTLVKVLWEDGEIRAVQPDSIIVYKV